jgi:hypothetical protein
VLKRNHRVLNTGKEELRGSKNLKNVKNVMNLLEYFASEYPKNEICKGDVKEKLECQSDFSEVQTFQSPVINLFDPGL